MWGNLGSQAQGNYQNAQANNVGATNRLSQYLTSDPATNTYNAQQVSNAEQGANLGYQREGAQLDQSLAQRGMGPSSAAAVGGRVAMANAQAANNAGIQNQVAQNNINRQAQNLAANQGLWNGQQGQYFGQAGDALGQQAGVNSGLLTNATNLAENTYNQQVAQQNAQDQLWGSLAGAAGTVWGDSLTKPKN
jgi:hypothetical protein